MERMLTAREIADSLGVRENWVYDHAITGDIPSYKIGGCRRFQRSEVEDWLSARRQPRREVAAARAFPTV
jgi:excisionase family DNA binding protein